MHITHAELMLSLLCALAGAVHVLAPDHWFPLSVVAWQRQWSTLRTLAFATLAFTLHVGSAFGLYWLLSPLLKDVAPSQLLFFAIVLMVCVTFARGLRFRRLREVLGVGPKSIWGMLAVLSLLGPAESIIPIFVKANQMGHGHLLPFLAYLLGTVLSGCAAILVGRYGWNRPLWLPLGIRWAQQRGMALPFVLGVTVGLSFLVRLSG